MSDSSYNVTLGRIISEFKLEELNYVPGSHDILIKTSDINRPGLQLAGFYEYCDTERIQIIGTVEMAYLASLSYEERYASLKAFFKHDFPCVIIARGKEPFPEMVELATEYGVPLLRTDEETSRFASYLILYLNVELAPRITMHGVLVEVYGEGVLMLGESGVGKSETALELVKRGHRLVADDVVEIRKVSNRTLVGSSPDIIRHFIEIRGVGIIDVKNLYGVGAVKMTENINLVVNMELWDTNKQYDRLGINDEYTEILGIKVPSLTIPVRPGRNLAIIIEVAAMNHRQKKMGYNAAKVLNERVMREIERNSMRNMNGD
ncbi:HPr kinase/phosphorylase HprK [Thermoclostridium stercorarium subsp. stercorarium DSM 8532]|uniref:HPr kinase/phosphorylase n=3 Tax=Thermoclostridium stercorarium TaxID=1510 RepID=L7VNP9_THES1|nr:HPr(Ser) kinase/phosphatase [Thermoclostridium stercorarium]AGC68407.1 HPr kinase/phosphorylase HprK [Thermoclostridium stercorarium subsp. stercorarium DSM 8532]ANX00017.1 HPr kinase/phosphorylase [Thermoclostridium stercorarium subsp. thermolacticum DSM 2910]ANX02661.1 HPr kinase/phosphorylase [Thermoclostridium stercorarium subsp. leptospartum DSM 9219]